jgi:hypothetical protein
VISKDYLEKIKDSAISRVMSTDSIGWSNGRALKMAYQYYGGAVGKLVTRNGRLKIIPRTWQRLFFTGTFSSSIEVGQVNREPATQDLYSQGRSVNGKLSWRGPETNELFSYGPAITNLEYDGGSYPYDVNGRLVERGTGNGQAAYGYPSTLFRRSARLTQTMNLQGGYIAGRSQYQGRIIVGQGHENSFVRDNSNSTHNLSAAFEGNVSKFKFSGAYNLVSQGTTNSNRYGFLNRVYQNSLLTPVSFDNTQGTFIASQQRSYSSAADNPLFLLDNESRAFTQLHRSAKIVLDQVIGQLRLRVTQGFSKFNESAREGYKPGTAYFPGGSIFQRDKNDVSYSLSPNISYDIDRSYRQFRSTLSVNYVLENAKTHIDYPAVRNTYQRTSHDVAIRYKGNYSYYNTAFGINGENKMYFSNTSTAQAYFLPAVSGYVQFRNLLEKEDLSVKLVAGYNRFNSELPVNISYARAALTQLATAAALKYLPVTEVASIDNLLPTRHSEWKTRLEVGYKNRLTFSAETFRRRIADDIYPFFENGAFVLKNVATHRNAGIELGLDYDTYSKYFSTSHSLSFVSTRDIVTAVSSGYDYTPIAGFSDVNKVVAAGRVLGAIAGSKWLRDNAGNMIIGNDGFPLVDPRAGIIGNPAPRFVMKMYNGIRWKAFSFSIACEWKNGGQVWNGTQAVLDYFGRSAASGELRNTVNYIYAGVLQNGHPNDIPVKFYDPTAPFDRNRWVRYGYAGVAEAYIQKADWLRINSISLGYQVRIRKYLQSIDFNLYANNIVVWTPYKGADPAQLLFDQDNTNGLDFFNLPSVKHIGASISIQF